MHENKYAIASIELVDNAIIEVKHNKVDNYSAIFRKNSIFRYVWDNCRILEKSYILEEFWYLNFRKTTRWQIVLLFALRAFDFSSRLMFIFLSQEMRTASTSTKTSNNNVARGARSSRNR